MMRTRSLFLLWIPLSGALLGAAVLSSDAVAQPRRFAERFDRGEITPERLRAELERTREREARLVRALERLEAGERLDPDALSSPEAEWPAKRAAEPRDGADAEEGDPDIDPETMLQTLRQADPDLFERLRRLRERRPAEGFRQLQRLAPRIRELVRLRRENPDAFAERVERMRIQREMMRIGRQMVEATRAGEDTASLRAQMRNLVEAELDARLDFQSEQIERMESRLADAKEELAAHRAHRESLVEERMEMVLKRIESAATSGDAGNPSSRMRRR